MLPLITEDVDCALQVEAKLQSLGALEVVLMLPKHPSLGSNADEPRSLRKIHGNQGDVAYTLQMKHGILTVGPYPSISHDKIRLGTLLCWDVGSSCPSDSFGSNWNRPDSNTELRTEYRSSPRGLKQLSRGKRTFRSRIVTLGPRLNETLAFRQCFRDWGFQHLLLCNYWSSWIPIDPNGTCLFESGTSTPSNLDLQYSSRVHIFTQGVLLFLYPSYHKIKWVEATHHEITEWSRGFAFFAQRASWTEALLVLINSEFQLGKMDIGCIHVSLSYNNVWQVVTNIMSILYWSSGFNQA